MSDDVQVDCTVEDRSELRDEAVVRQLLLLLPNPRMVAPRPADLVRDLLIEVPHSKSAEPCSWHGTT